MTNLNRSVLVIGATGKTGLDVLRALQRRGPEAAVHAFVRTPSKLPSGLSSKCTSVITGDARDAASVQHALERAQVTDVVMCIGDPNPLAKTDVRAATARALADAVRARRAASGSDTRVVLLSCLGVGDSKVIFGFGMGVAMRLFLARVLKDHEEQERVLKGAFAERKKQLLIVRPTSLADGDATGIPRIHDGSQKSSTTVVRADVAEWMVGQMCGKGDMFGKAVAICSK